MTLVGQNLYGAFPVKSFLAPFSVPTWQRPGHGAQRRGWEATRSHAQRTLQREHGGDGKQRAFPGVSTVAFWVAVGRLMVVANSGLVAV